MLVNSRYLFIYLSLLLFEPIVVTSDGWKDYNHTQLVGCCNLTELLLNPCMFLVSTSSVLVINVHLFCPVLLY